MATNIRRYASWVLIALLPGGCAGQGGAGPEPPDEPGLQVLQLVDDTGNRYELPYRAAVGPAELATQVSVAVTSRGDGREILLAPSSELVRAPQNRTGDPGEEAGIELWPVRAVDPAREDTVLIAGTRVCWDSESIGAPGYSNWYYIYSAFLTAAFVHPRDYHADYDLYLYEYSSDLLCSSSRGPGEVDSCDGYDRNGYYRDWSYQVYRFGGEWSTYRLCIYYYY